MLSVGWVAHEVDFLTPWPHAFDKRRKYINGTPMHFSNRNYVFFASAIRLSIEVGLNLEASLLRLRIDPY